MNNGMINPMQFGQPIFQQGMPNTGYPVYAQQQPQQYIEPQVQYQQQVAPQPVQNNNIPTITIDEGKSLFSSLTSDKPINIGGTSVVPANTKSGKRKKELDVEVLDENGNVINKRDDIASLANLNVEDTYKETSNMVKGTVAQLDILAGELKGDLDSIRASRTLKNKYRYITDITSSMSTVLSTKLMALRELNSTVKNINDAKYRQAKDMRAAEAGNDDKYIMDMYNAFITNPVGTQVPLGINTMDITMNNNPNIRGVDVGGPSNMISSRATTAPGSSGIDTSGMTPEQAMMIYEQDPNVRQCVVFDKLTGNKWFQVMNTSTGETIQNVPVRDPMFLEDTTIDERNGIARNTNLNETYPLIVLNGDKFKDF